MDTKPLLSIGIIFKNEARCLERCLKSLAPLREAVPCELVMADTGSTDGSREIAEKYADTLFDFPWIDDFAAARNAVMDRCSGEWYMTIDADEWLDGDIFQLAEFLNGPERWERPFCSVIQRNYLTPELDEEHNDFLAVRLARMSAGARYVGAIHELWDHRGNISGLLGTVFHHDGYVHLGTEQGKEKQERNLALLRKKLERDPEDLKTLLQCIESSQNGADHEQYIRRAAAGVEKRLPLWEYYGPPILRYAIFYAAVQNLPELDGWLSLARSRFPDSPYIGIDGAYMVFVTRAEREEFAQAIPFGEEYLRSVAGYRAGKFDYTALLVSSLCMASRPRENIVRALLAGAYTREKRFREARETLLAVDRGQIRPNAAGFYMGALLDLQAQGGEDLSPVMSAFWEEIREKGGDLRGAVIRASAQVFTPEYRREEAENGFRHACTLFLPLAGKCGLGTAAAMLESADPRELERLLGTVEDWEELPVAALAHALGRGAAFPPPGRPLKIEEMDTLASRLSQDRAAFFPLALGAAERTDWEDWQSLVWLRGLLMAAVRVWPWPDEEQDAEEGMAVARAFARVEGRFLPLCYAAGVLREDRLFLLPPLHRFGWYCARAFAALDDGDRTGYVRLLREGLAVCESAKPMAEFLLRHTPQLQGPKPSAELLALAEKVRTMLLAYAPDDPAVTALKQSPAYQKVAHLIEGIDGGGLPS